MSKKYKPTSKKLIDAKVDNFYITTAYWWPETAQELGWGKTYETGIRDLLTDEFTLIQYASFHFSDFHNKIRELLIMGYKPFEVQERIRQVEDGLACDHTWEGVKVNSPLDPNEYESVCKFCGMQRLDDI